MIEIASDLRQRFEWAMDVCLEAYEVLPDGKSFLRSDQDEHAIGVFESLRDSVDAIPPSLLAMAENLRVAAPELFEKLLANRIQMIGPEFSPVSAAEFVEILNRTFQRDLSHV